MNGRVSNAWSLLEVLAVIAIVSVMLALAFPSVSGLMKSTAHRGAIDQAMALFDHARMLAVANGRTSYVVFSDTKITDHDRWFRAAAIYQDSADLAQGPVAVTAWRVLPTGISFNADVAVCSLFNAPPDLLPDGITPVSFPVPGQGNLALPHLTFGSTGTVLYPNSPRFAGVSLSLGPMTKNGASPGAATADPATTDRISIALATGWPKYESAIPRTTPASR